VGLVDDIASRHLSYADRSDYHQPKRFLRAERHRCASPPPAIVVVIVPGAVHSQLYVALWSNDGHNILVLID